LLFGVGHDEGDRFPDKMDLSDGEGRQGDRAVEAGENWMRQAHQVPNETPGCLPVEDGAHPGAALGFGGVDTGQHGVGVGAANEGHVKATGGCLVVEVADGSLHETGPAEPGGGDAAGRP